MPKINKAKAKEVLLRHNGGWVSNGDKLVTSWGQGKYELEDWSNRSYSYAETDSIDEAIAFLES